MTALDRWAHAAGYNDFPTFIAAGGSLLEARSDIRQRIRSLEDALIALGEFNVPPRTAKTDDDEPPDQGNAEIQGVEQ